MKITIREETAADHTIVFDLIEAAFHSEEMSDHREHWLVNQLRKSDAFIPELSLVACHKEELVGHILLTKINIKGSTVTHESLALAPVSVLPKYQNKGIGSQLILEVHRRATQLGYTSIILLGHADYYPRFGYEKTSKYGITLPFEASEENCMVIALREGGLDGVSGMVEYSKPFFE